MMAIQHSDFKAVCNACEVVLDSLLAVADLAESVPFIGVGGKALKKIIGVIRAGQKTFAQLKDVLNCLTSTTDAYVALNAIFKSLPSEYQVSNS